MNLIMPSQPGGSSGNAAWWRRGKLERLPQCEEIRGKYIAQRDWRQDPKGYFLIRINREEGLLEVGFCPELNKMAFVFRGKRPEDIYHEVAKRDLIAKTDHYSYLGLELEKAFLALQFNLSYEQDEDLILPG